MIINGLGQLDGGGDSLLLVVVRLEETGRDAKGSITIPMLIERLRARLSDCPEALRSFNSLLHLAGWQDVDTGGGIVVRLVLIDEHEVNAAFPRLVHGLVPPGVLDATYKIVLPPPVASV